MTRAALKKKQTYHHGDLARALIAAALELVEERGIEGFTLREAASRVGVTHGAAYRHFDDKLALLAVIAEEGYRDLASELASVHENDPIVCVRELIRAYVAFALENPARYRIMSGPRLNETNRFPSLEDAVSEAVTPLANEIKRGQQLGAIRAGRTRDIGIALFVFAHGYVEQVLRRRIKVKNRAVAIDYFLTLAAPLLDGLRR